MALTKQQALDKFCLRHEYQSTKLQGESKLEFLKRKQKEWALEEVKKQVQGEKFLEGEANYESEVIGLDI